MVSLRFPFGAAVTTQQVAINDSEKAYRKALILLRRKEFEVALSYLDDACHADPQSMLYRAYRAYAAYLCGRCNEGAVLRLVHTYTLMESKDTPQLMLLLGHIRRRTGKLEKAHYWYERAAELDPADAEIVARWSTACRPLPPPPPLAAAASGRRCAPGSASERGEPPSHFAAATSYRHNLPDTRRLRICRKSVAGGCYSLRRGPQAGRFQRPT